MAIGYPKNKASIDSIVGGLAQSVNQNFRRAVQLKAELDSYPDGALTSLGYTSGEVTTLRTMAADLVQLSQVYEGDLVLGAAKDFRDSLRPVWGILGDQ